MPESKEIQIHIPTQDQQIDDLIGHAPGWLLHSGITIVALVAAILITISALIKYPDKIVAEGIMSSGNPPIAHVTQVSGIIDKIFVENGEEVEDGDALIYMKNNVNIADLESLKGFVSRYKQTKKVPHFLDYSCPKNLQLGNLQNSYTQLQLQFAHFQQTLRQSGVFQQIKTLENEIEKTTELRAILQKEKAYSKDELELIERDFKRSTILNKEGVISDVDKEKVEGEWIRYQKQYANLDNGIVQNKIKEEQLILQSQQLIEERAIKVESHQHSINQIIAAIESEIVKWERDHYVLTEINGQVLLQPNIAADKHVNANTKILSVIPQTLIEGKSIKAYVDHNGIGKISKGDKCILKVNAYPHKEYGTITSVVSEISKIPVAIEEHEASAKYGYLVTANIPDTLITTYGREIPFRPESKVSTEIITEDNTILERILNTFISLINQE